MTENPGLHLIWYYDRIYIKPIQPYLLARAFWEYVEEADPDLWRAAAGFMRTYCHLVQYESDFRLAANPELSLIPNESQVRINFEDFIQFASQFQDLSDTAVSPRFSYGEIRLTRLNHLARLTLYKLTYFHLHAQWDEFVGKFLAPVLTLLALVGTTLGAMQVGLAVQPSTGSASPSAFSQVSAWFSFAVMTLVAVIFGELATFASFVVIKDQLFA